MTGGKKLCTPREWKGNAKVYVWLLIRSPLSIKVLVEKYALQGIFGYAANERFDSKLIRPEAIKVIKIEDSVE